MIDFILSLIKYTAIFMCMLYAFTRLLRIKLKAWDVFDIPLFIALSAVLHFVKIYVKILVPIGLLISGIVFLFLRFRKTFYETVTVGTMALGISTVTYILAILLGFPIAVALYFIENEIVKNIIIQLSISTIQIVGTFLLFKIKRLRSGVNPKGETATFEILLFLSVGCIFAWMLSYTKNATQSIYETVLLILTLFGLLLILWWRRHITYNYREAVKQQNVNLMEDTIEEYKLSAVEKDLQAAAAAKLFHYLNRVLPNCFGLAERAAAQTGCADAFSVVEVLRGVLRELDIANNKFSFKNIPLTGVSAIDMPIMQLFAEAEHKSLNVSAKIFVDVEVWFTDGKLHKHDINILLIYLCDNALISAHGSQGARVRVELDATANKKPLIRIYDSGEQFDEEVLAKLGLEQITTHADEGGSGIGLFTVFEILAKYGASFTINEAPQTVGFTKCVEVAFDGRREVLVRTYRESVVAVCAKRKGLTVELLGGEALRDGTNG